MIQPYTQYGIESLTIVRFVEVTTMTTITAVIAVEHITPIIQVHVLPEYRLVQRLFITVQRVISS